MDPLQSATDNVQKHQTCHWHLLLSRAGRANRQAIHSYNTDQHHCLTAAPMGPFWLPAFPSFVTAGDKIPLTKTVGVFVAIAVMSGHNLCQRTWHGCSHWRRMPMLKAVPEVQHCSCTGGAKGWVTAAFFKGFPAMIFLRCLFSKQPVWNQKQPARRWCYTRSFSRSCSLQTTAQGILALLNVGGIRTHQLHTT